MPEKHLRVDEAAALLGLAPYTVREWLRLGKLRGVKLGDGKGRAEWRVPESALVELTESFVSNRKVETVKAAG